MSNYTLYKCQCGAIGIDDGTGEIKCAKDLETFNKKTGLNLTENDLESATKVYNCNHCVNHWGMDLCQCGSGEDYETCDCGCKEPSQTFNLKQRRMLWVF